MAYDITTDVPAPDTLESLRDELAETRALLATAADELSLRDEALAQLRERWMAATEALDAMRASLSAARDSLNEANTLISAACVLTLDRAFVARAREYALELTKHARGIDAALEAKP